MRRSNDPWPAEDARATGHEAWSIMSRMLTGLLLYGGLGWLVGRWLGAEATAAAVGAIFGLTVATYASYKRVISMDAGPLIPDQPDSAVSWSQRMTRVRMREAREASHGC